MDMFGELWTLVLYVYGAFQSLWACPAPEILSVHHLNTEEYMGTWYFIAAVGSRPSDIKQFIPMDSTVFVLQEGTQNSTYLLTGHIRVGDSCLTHAWTYHVQPDKHYLDLEGLPNRQTIIWGGKGLNCPDCVLLQETDLGEIADKMNRIMLYARNGSLSTSVVKNFRSKMSCLGMTEFLTLPQEKEYCEKDGSGSA